MKRERKHKNITAKGNNRHVCIGMLLYEGFTKLILRENMLNSWCGWRRTRPTGPRTLKEVILAPDVQRNPRSLAHKEGRHRNDRIHQGRAEESTRSSTPEGPNPNGAQSLRGPTR